MAFYCINRLVVHREGSYNIGTKRVDVLKEDILVRVVRILNVKVSQKVVGLSIEDEVRHSVEVVGQENGLKLADMVVRYENGGPVFLRNLRRL